MRTKEEIRSKVKKERLLLNKSSVERLSALIIKRVKTVIGDFQSFLFYYPFKNEASLLPLATKLLSLKKGVMFPKVMGNDMAAISIASVKDLSPGFMSIMEPIFNPKRVKQHADIAFIPGIAFDENGYRIGYGKGFYDRFLKRFDTRLKIGIAFDFQVLKHIPFDPFDIPMDVVITEKRTIRRKTWK